MYCFIVTLNAIYLHILAYFGCKITFQRFVDVAIITNFWDLSMVPHSENAPFTVTSTQAVPWIYALLIWRQYSIRQKLQISYGGIMKNICRLRRWMESTLPLFQCLFLTETQIHVKHTIRPNTKHLFRRNLVTRSNQTRKIFIVIPSP